MEPVNTNTEKKKKNFIEKTWKRCRSFSHLRPATATATATTAGSGGGGGGGLVKCKSWHGKESKKKKIAPEGFFPVYVGPEKQRFAIKTKYANHPLFTVLLEDAETEFGYNCNGPILLPCDVDLFCKVLVEMKAKDGQPLVWNFTYGPCSPFNPGRRLGIIGVDEMTKGYGSYEALTH